MKSIILQCLVTIFGTTGWLLLISVVPDALAKPDNLVLYFPVYHLPFAAVALVFPAFSFAYLALRFRHKGIFGGLLALYLVGSIFFVLSGLGCQVGCNSGDAGLGAFVLFLFFIIALPLSLIGVFLVKRWPILGYTGCVVGITVLAAYFYARKIHGSFWLENGLG